MTNTKNLQGDPKRDQSNPTRRFISCPLLKSKVVSSRLLAISNSYHYGEGVANETELGKDAYSVLL